MVLGRSLLPLALSGNQFPGVRETLAAPDDACRHRSGPTQVENFPARDLPGPTCDMTVPTDEKSLL